MSKLSVPILLAAIVTGAFASQSSAATPKQYGWSETEAEAFVMQRVRLPACLVFPADSRCFPDGTPRVKHLYGWRPESATCIGANELGASFTYPRFECAITVGGSLNELAHIAVYVTGPATFRWKTL